MRFGEGPAGVRVRLVGKPGCHLCDDARLVVARVCAELDAAWDEVSIEDDPQLAARYWEKIPVVLVDGEPQDFWRVDEQRLRETLQGRRRRTGLLRRQAGPGGVPGS